MSKLFEIPPSQEQVRLEELRDLLPEEGMWLLHASKALMDAAIALAVVYYLPVAAIVLMTMYSFSYMKNPRQTVVGVVPIIWGSNLLVYNIAEVATVVTYLSVRRLTTQVIESIGRKLCASIQTSLA